MNRKFKLRGAVTAVRHHPVRAAAICVPLLAASVLTGQSMASATPTPTLAVSQAALNAAPAPHVLIADNNMSSQVVKVKPAKAGIKEPWNLDGCDHDYGTPNQCVPWQIPGSTSAAKCTWLASMGFGSLQVYGTNRQDLPENAQGYVCASGS
jgi:hypothetical protein